MPLDKMAESDRRAAEEAFLLRMMQNALFHRISSGVDAVDGSRFKELGYFQDVNAPEAAACVVDALRAASESKQPSDFEGPLLFVREHDRVSVSDIAELLLCDNRHIRCLVVNYMARPMPSANPWLSQYTRGVFNDAASLLQSDSRGWRQAAIDVNDALRNDVNAHFAAVRQSLAYGYIEGVERYVQCIMRPTFNALAHIRPPLWNLAEQSIELRSWIGEFASLPTLEGALDAYLAKCGYLPLAGDFGASRVIEQWHTNNAAVQMSWDRIWSWAEACRVPAARYHAIVAAIRLPGLRPLSQDDLWREIATIMSPRTGEEGEALKWRMFCDAAGHYLSHIEALYPGQDGERAACYAWWLAHRCCELFCHNDRMLSHARKRMLEPELEMSQKRWLIARSPINPSPLRYMTQSLETVWALSLFAEINGVKDPLDQATEALRESVRVAFQEIIIPAWICNHCEEGDAPFAFVIGAMDGTGSALGSILDPGDIGFLQTIAKYRLDLSQSQNIEQRLADLANLTRYDQLLTLMFAGSAVASTRKYDDVISNWIENNDSVCKAISSLPLELLPKLLDVVVECQQRQWGELRTRIPHTIAYAVNKLKDRERVEHVIPYVVLLSVNVDIVSPIQRIAMSYWKALVIDSLRQWRDGMAHLSVVSEPWVAARIRGTVSALSRLVGPQTAPPSRADESSDDVIAD